MAQKVQTVDEKISERSPLKPQDTQDNELRSSSSNAINKADRVALEIERIVS